MFRKPLTPLIAERGFDRFQAGLRARCAAYRLNYSFTYCEPTDNSALRLDFESPNHIGRVTVWESGECDLQVLDIASSETVFSEHHELSTEEEFHATYPKLVIFMRDALRPPTNVA